jgi:hypothetical protein
MKLEFFRQNFEKHLDIKFHKNPSSGSRVVPCGQKEGRKKEGQTDIQTYRHTDMETYRHTDRQTDIHDEDNRRFAML